MMNITPIRTDSDYDAVLGRVDVLMDAAVDTPEGDELDVLVTLLEAYEQKNFYIDAPDPVEFIKNAMKFKGVDQTGLARVLNSRSRASEILNRQRPLTLDNIRKITSAWRIPADSLISEYKIATRNRSDAKREILSQRKNQRRALTR